MPSAQCDPEYVRLPTNQLAGDYRCILVVWSTTDCASVVVKRPIKINDKRSKSMTNDRFRIATTHNDFLYGCHCGCRIQGWGQRIKKNHKMLKFATISSHAFLLSSTEIAALGPRHILHTRIWSMYYILSPKRMRLSLNTFSYAENSVRN